MFVRVRADTGDATRGINQVHDATNRLAVTTSRSTHGMSAWSAIQAEAAGHLGEHSFAIGRLERALASYSGHAVGASRITEILAVSLGKFALGSIEITAIVAGIAAIVGIYEKLTEGQREAEKATNELIAALIKANNLKGQKPGAETQKQIDAARGNLGLGLERVAVLTRARDTIKGRDPIQANVIQAQIDAQKEANRILLIEVKSGGETVTAEKNKARFDERKTLEGSLKDLISSGVATSAQRTVGLNLLRKYQAEYKKVLASSPNDLNQLSGLQDHINGLQSALFPKVKEGRKETEKLVDAAMQANKMFENLVATTLKLIEAHKQLGNPFAQLEWAANESLGLNDPGAIAKLLGLDKIDTSAPLGSDPKKWEASPGGILTKEQLDRLKKINESTSKGTEILKGAIEHSAQIIGSVVGAALNIGGGGKGSQVGGALGSGIGAILGSGLTKGAGGITSGIFGIVGGLVGGLAGSLFGGLFGKHKKSVDKNSDAINRLTASLVNVPQGFNVTAYRNRYADPTSPYTPKRGKHAPDDGGSPIDVDGGNSPIGGGGAAMIYVANVNANSSSELVTEAKRAAARGGTSALRFAIVGV